MPRLHYLARSDASLPASEALGRQSPQKLERDNILCLQADAKSLASKPLASDSYRLAKQIQWGLESHQQALVSQPPLGFPLSQAEGRQVGILTAAWHVLGQAYARWYFSQPQPKVLADAIACLRQIVFLHGVYHCRLPEGVWLDLHTLFRAAQQAGSSKARGFRLRRAVMPQLEYFKAQLLSLADPCALLPQELILLDALLEKWVALVKIAADSGEGWCPVEGVDAPAEWREVGSDLRLDLSELAGLLRSHRQFVFPMGRFAAWERAPETIPFGLLEHVERSWFKPPSLKTRRETWPEAEWIVGLEDIFARLQGKAVRAISARMEKVTQAPSGSLQVGDLVGVFAIGSDELIGLARIDRIEWSGGAQNLAVRLEVIPGEVFPVGIQPIYRVRQPCAYQRGLLLADQGRLELLLAEQPLPESLTVRLLHRDKLYPVYLDHRRNLARRTLSYRCASAVDLVQK